MYRFCRSSFLLIIPVVIVLNWPFACVTQVENDEVRLTLRRVQYSHNSSVNFNITDIGEYTYYESLICQTDKRPCCRSNRVGEWHYPNGTRVPIEGTGSDMYRNRDDDGQVRLNRRNNAIYPLGTYTCIVPDATDTIQVVHATLQYPGNNAIVDLSYNSNSSKLTCVTSAGQATSLYGESINGQPINSTFLHLSVIFDPRRMTYNNILNMNTRNNIYFMCITRNKHVTYFATLLTGFIGDNRALSSQLIGRIGEQVTLLCLADEQLQVQSTSWRGTATTNLTFTGLTSANAGVYTCNGTTLNNREVSHSVNLTVSSCTASVQIFRREPTAIIGQNYTLTCDVIQWGSECNIEAYFIYHKNKLKSTSNTLTFTPFNLSDANGSNYVCIATVNGFNFTSNPTYLPSILAAQLPTPNVSINNSLANPVPVGSFPTLTCTIRYESLDLLSIEKNLIISVSWNGPVYGFGEFSVTDPLLNSSAQVPTYTSTALLNADGTFYDSGEYSCSAVVSVKSNSEFIQNGLSTSQSISVLFHYPRRPYLYTISNVGHSWIYISWYQGSGIDDDIHYYEVQYSYIGECTGIGREIHTQTIGSSDLSYNITGLGGKYYNYSINLTAVNSAGRSPPYTAYATTQSGAPSGSPQAFRATLVHSTNISVQWERVDCRYRNSEISHYSLRYSLDDGSEEMNQIDVGVGDRNLTSTVVRLQPRSTYTVSIAAVNTNREEGPYTAITVTTSAPENVPFQISLSGVHNCLQWRISYPEEKVHDVSEGIVSDINNHCPHCRLEIHDITQREFQCFPGSPNQVTFRGKVQDRAQATAREVIYYMELWVSSSDVVTIPVHHARLDINSTCVILIASLDDPECSGYLTASPVHTVTTYSDVYSTTDTTTQPTITDRNLRTTGTHDSGPLPPFTSTSQDQPQDQSVAGVIVGGVVAVTFILTIGFILIFLLYILFKYCNLNKSSSMAIQKNSMKDGSKDVPVAIKEHEDQLYDIIEMKKKKTPDSMKTDEPHKVQKGVTESDVERCEMKEEESYYEL